MFTGIIEKTGKIIEIDNKNNKTYFTVEVKNFLRNVKIGDSISCDGACLTVIKKIKDNFTVELMPETLRMTKFKDSKVGDLINLELALKIRERIDGHFVMGHIDGTGKVDKIIKSSKNIDLVIKAPMKLLKYFPRKGSITINGVSLTIADSKGDKVKVCLIEHTLKETSLSRLKQGSLVNIEVDMMARYLERLFKKPIK